MDWVPKQLTGHKVPTGVPPVAALGKEPEVGVVDHVIGIRITRVVESITAEKGENIWFCNSRKLTIFAMSFKNSPNVVHQSQIELDARVQS
jgi:hypothetical protein